MTKNIKYAIGVDLGGTNIKLGIISETGKIYKKHLVETKADGGPKVVIQQIKKGILEILDGEKLKVEGIGIGSPGVVASDKGIVENPPNLPGWQKVPLGKSLEKIFNIKVSVENDANAAAIGELIYGSGKKLNSFVMITLGTGVGGGIIMDKKLYKGKYGAGGEIGHITIDFKGPKCGCGSYGCIEAYAGNSYLIKKAKDEISDYPKSKIYKLIDNDLENITPKVISQALFLDDKYAKIFVNDLAKCLGAALASVANILDISTFVLGGGVSGFGSPLFKAIEANAKERVLTPLKNRVKVVPAKLKNEAGIQGAAALVFY